jgi:hypothetical protein
MTKTTLSKQRPSAPASTGSTQIRRVADRLRQEIALVLEAVPPEWRGMTRLSEWTGVPKPLCFRVIDAARAGPEPLDLLVALPGVRGLERTMLALGERIGVREVRTAARRSVQTYRELLDLLGGTQLKARKAATAMLSPEHAHEPDASLAARRTAFEGARGVTGVWSEALSIVQCVSPPVPGRELLTTTMVTGHVGLHPGHAALPVVFLWRNREQVARAFESLEADRPHGLNQYALLPEFSSDPFPQIITQGEPGFERDTLEWDESTLVGGAGVDVFAGIRGAEPPTPGPLTAHTVVRVPTRKLVIDMLLPHELDLGGPTSSASYFIGIAGTVGNTPAARWHDRLHDLPRPADSSAGRPADFVPCFESHHRLIDHVVRVCAATRDRFRHLRWVVAYPLWGCDHAITVAPGASGVPAKAGATAPPAPRQRRR